MCIKNTFSTLDPLFYLLLVSLVQLNGCIGEWPLNAVVKNIQNRGQSEVSFCHTSGFDCGHSLSNANVNAVPHGTVCSHASQTDLECINGIWFPLSNSHTGRRHKRFVLTLIALGVGIGVGHCIHVCGKEDEHKNEPPVFEVCLPGDLQSSYEAEINQTTKMVRWTIPKAVDPEGKLKAVRRVAGRGPDVKYGEGTHHQVYKAVDYDGGEAFCDFDFKVKVLRCSAPVTIPNGNYTCTNFDFRWGTTCRYTCHSGFDIQDNSRAVITCQKSRRWSPKAAVCGEILCPRPEAPVNGYFDCSNGYKYQSVCWPRCNKGYKLENTPYIKCTSDRKWFNTPSQPIVCKDAIPPKVECLTPQIFFVDLGRRSKRVFWKRPTTYDESDKVIQLTQISGPEIGTELQLGIHNIQYKATDDAGNESNNCSIRIVVEESVCQDPSATQFEFMKVTCSGYKYGATCQLSCQANLPLNGSNVIICQRNDTTVPPKTYWSWDSDGKPSCKRADCPALEPPINGAMSCTDTINLRPFCSMSCNENYDIPYKHDGKFLCTDKGLWSPNATVDCTELRRPDLMFLPSELYYYSGNCNDDSVKQRIKRKFIAVAEQVSEKFNLDVCGNNRTCDLRNITVSCGDERHRNKRDTAATTVAKFQIAVSWTPTGKGIRYDLDVHYKLQEDLVAVFNKTVNQGLFNVSGASLDRNSFQHAPRGELLCTSGTFLDPRSATCKSCAVGTYYNSVVDGCTLCPVGTYKDHEAATECKRCPDATSTTSPGSKSQNDCKELCPAGMYSVTGVMPCFPCETGFYQTNQGQRNCNKCPAGEITIQPGATSIHDCSDFELRINSSSSNNIKLGTVEGDWSEMTFAVWLRRLDTDGAVTFSVQNSTQKKYLEIAVSANITVNYRGDTEIVTAVAKDKWTLVVLCITIDVDSELPTLKVFLNEQVLIDKVLHESTNKVVSSGSQFYVSVIGNAGFHISGLSVSNAVPINVDLMSTRRNCFNTFPYPVLSMSNFIPVIQPGIDVVMPPTCDPVDECQSSPCGDGHLCKNLHPGFECICFNGHTGKTCDIAPDACVNNNCRAGSICKSNGTGYICECTGGTSGPFCETLPADGTWSDWSEWSSCSVTCGPGTHWRMRGCESLGRNGLLPKECIGNKIEIKSCSIKKCKECPALQAQQRTTLSCWTKDNTTFCNLTCSDPGEAFAPGIGHQPLYKCGPNTGHEWSHVNSDNPAGILPSCSRFQGGQDYEVKLLVTYEIFPCNRKDSALRVIHRQLLDRMDCVQEKSCPLLIDVPTCNESRQQNEHGANLVLKFSVHIHNPAGLNLSQYFSDKIGMYNDAELRCLGMLGTVSGNDVISPENRSFNCFNFANTVNEPLLEILNAIELVEGVIELVKNRTDWLLSFVLDGTRYQVIHDMPVTIETEIRCPQGFVSHVGLCVECPSGTWQSGARSCTRCRKGTFQEAPGSTTCKFCPLGLSTERTGAVHTSECTVRLMEKKDGENSNAGPLIGAAVAGGVVVVIVFAVSIVLIARRFYQKDDERGTFAKVPTKNVLNEDTKVDLHVKIPKRHLPGKMETEKGHSSEVCTGYLLNVVEVDDRQEDYHHYEEIPSDDLYISPVHKC